MGDLASRTDKSTSGHGRTLGVLFGGVFLGALDIAIVGPALPAIQQSFGLDSRQQSLIFIVYILFTLIGAPLLAAWSDRAGRRRVYLAALASFGIGSMLVAIAPSFWLLIFGRAIQAFGAGGTLPIAGAVIADTFPLERRGRALGLIGAVFGIAFIVGPLLGGLLLQWSWRWLFLINLPLLALLMPAAARVLPATTASRGRSVDWSGAAALAIGLAALAWAVSRVESTQYSGGLQSPMSLGLLAFAGLALWQFWRIENTATDPILHPDLMRSKQLQVVGLLAVATGLVEASMVFLPALSVTAFEVSASRASLMLMPLVGALIVGSAVAGRLLDKIGPKPVIQFGMGLIIVGLLLFAILPLTQASFYAAGLSIGFGLASLLGAPLRFVALQEAGANKRGASQGLLTVFLGSGRMFGAALIGGIVASDVAPLSGYKRAMLAIAIAAGVGLVSSCWLRGGRGSPVGATAE